MENLDTLRTINDVIDTVHVVLEKINVIKTSWRNVPLKTRSPAVQVTVIVPFEINFMNLLASRFWVDYWEQQNNLTPFFSRSFFSVSHFSLEFYVQIYQETHLIFVSLLVYTFWCEQVAFHIRPYEKELHHHINFLYETWCCYDDEDLTVAYKILLWKW